MSTFVIKVRQMLSRYSERVRERAFLDAAMAASALVASADGDVSLAELLSRDDILDRVEALQAFDTEVAVSRFRSYLRGIETDHGSGAARALAAVAAFGEDPELAPLLLRVAVAIAKADARISPEEQAVIEQLTQALGAEDIDLASGPA
jgi:tellurite resistance protein TerB